MTEHHPPLARAMQFVDFAFGALYSLIGFEFVLELLAARDGNPFKRFLDTMATPFLGPFRTLLTRVSMGGSEMIFSYLVALIETSSPDAAALTSAARSVLRESDPSVPVYDVATLASRMSDTVGERRFVTRLLGGFAAVALLLAAIGLYGLVSYGVAQRTREVGVRVALGARPGDVLRLILSGGVWLLAGGLSLGIAAAFLTTRLLGSLLYGVSPMDPVTFAFAALVLVAVAAAAHLIPALRALDVDPAVALRQP